MKIIGETTHGRLLLDASRDEVANLLGAYPAYQLKEAGLSENDLKPGVDINVRGAWDQLYWFSNRGDEFTELRRALADALKRLDESKPLFSAIKAA